MKKNYDSGLNAWEDFDKKVNELIIQNQFKNIAEIGGGANPLLSIDYVKNNQLVYHVMDVSTDELDKADLKYTKVTLDLEQPMEEPSFKYDFIFAQMTLEHIQDPHSFYTNVYSLLKPNGEAYFFYACLTSLPSFINFIIPEFLSEKILLALQPFRHNEKHGKFKAFYKWCFGPTAKNIKRFINMKFKIVSYTGYFGHSYYQKIKPLNFLEKIKTQILLKYPTAYLCSYAHVVLKK